MAISNLTSAGQTFERPSVSAYFGGRNTPANDNLQKTSSMFNDASVDKAIGVLGNLNSELSKMQEISKGLIQTFKKFTRDLQSTRKDIISKFTRLNSDINSSKVEFAKSAFTSPSIESSPIEEIGAPTLISKNDKPVTPSSGLSDIAGTIKDVVLDMLGGRAALATLGLLTGPLGLALLAFAGGGLILYKSLEALTKAIMNEEDFKRALQRDYGKTDPELMQENANKVREKNNPVGRQQRFEKREDAFKNNSWGDDGKPLLQGEVGGFFKDENGNEIWTLKKPLKDGTKYININSGEKYLSADWKEGKLQTTPTAPPPSVTEPANQNVRAKSDTGSSTATGAGEGGAGLNVVPDNEPVGSPSPASPSPPTAAPAPSAPTAAASPSAMTAPIDPNVAAEIAAKSEQYRDLGRKNVPLPDEIGADPIAGKNAILSWQEGQTQRNAGKPTAAVPANKAGGTGKQGDGLPNVNAPGVPDMFKTQPLMPSVNAPGVPDMFKTQPIMPSVNAPGVPEMFKTGSGQGPQGDYSIKGTNKFRNKYAKTKTADEVAVFEGQKTKAQYEMYKQRTVDSLGYSSDRGSDEEKEIVDRLKRGERVDPNSPPPTMTKRELANKIAEYGMPALASGAYSPEEFKKIKKQGNQYQWQTNAQEKAGEWIKSQSEEEVIKRSVKPLQPVVMNNSSSTNVGSTGGGETNNVSGQNFPMDASNPALLPFIARQNVQYQ